MGKRGNIEDEEEDMGPKKEFYFFLPLPVYTNFPGHTHSLSLPIFFLPTSITGTNEDYLSPPPFPSPISPHKSGTYITLLPP
mmetsp:Transcript_12034/g.16811  ORF Transcript_12034/g.16811 Transcript_12034/m.16811 type:complete len:82 (+) Transcript_12034:249-494(+)